MRQARWLLLALALSGCAPTLASQEGAKLPFVPAHTAHLQVGLRDIVVQFSDWPLRARKSLDIVFAPSGGSTQGLQGRLALIRPDGEIDTGADYLPRFVRDGRYWGLDSQAMDRPGRWQLSLTIFQQTGTLPLQVGPAPAGPPSGLISALAVLPLALLLGLALQAWWRVRPLRQLDSRSW